MARVQVIRQQKQQGFSLLELVVVICIIAILMAVAYERFERLAEGAEKAAFYGVLTTVQGQMNLQVADWYIDGEVITRAELEGKNPIEWLERPPANYRGNIKQGELTTAPAGQWFYLKEQQQLVYKVLRKKHLKTEEQGGILRFRVDVSYRRPQQNAGMVEAVALKVVMPFTWQPSDG